MSRARSHRTRTSRRSRAARISRPSTYGWTVKTLDANLSPDKQVSDVDTFINLRRHGLDHLDARPGRGRRGLQAGARCEHPDRRLRLDVERHVVGLRRPRLRLQPGPKAAANYIAKRVPKGKVLVIGGPPVPSITNYTNCFVKAAKKDGLNVVGKQNNMKDTAATAQPIVQDLLTKNPDVNAIWCYNDPSCLGAGAVVRARRERRSGSRASRRASSSRAPTARRDAAAGIKERPDHRDLGSAAVRHGADRGRGARDAPEGRQAALGTAEDHRRPDQDLGRVEHLRLRRSAQAARSRSARSRPPGSSSRRARHGSPGRPGRRSMRGAAAVLRARTPMTGHPIHPLDPLSAAEITAVVAAVRDGHDGDLRFVSVTMREPGKDALAAFAAAGTVPPREAEVVALEPAAAAAWEGLVEVGGGVRSWPRLEGRQPAIMPEEYESSRAADARRTPTSWPRSPAAASTTLARAASTRSPPAPGATSRGRRRGASAVPLAWVRPDADRQPVRAPDRGRRRPGRPPPRRGARDRRPRARRAVPPGDGEYRPSHTALPDRTGLKPLEITQPEGPSFDRRRQPRPLAEAGRSASASRPARASSCTSSGTTTAGGHARSSTAPRSARWPSRTATRARRGTSTPRSTSARTSSARSRTRSTLGCDCLGEIRYFDATVANGSGEPVVIRNAICMHEEDFGLLWKHWDFRTGETEVRRSRRLVISSISTIGNYDYGFYWYLLPGRDDRGRGQGDRDHRHRRRRRRGRRRGTAQLVAEGVNGMIHQHFFNVRLDFDLDGEPQLGLRGAHRMLTPPGPDNPFGNGFYAGQDAAGERGEAPRSSTPLRGRYWLVANEHARNAVASPVGLQAASRVRTSSRSPSPTRRFARRAGFAFQHVWVTRYDARRALRGRRVPEPAPRAATACRGWVEADRVDRGRGRRRLVHVRHPSPPATGGLAGDARPPHRLQAEAVRLLRREPGARRAAPPCLCPRAGRDVSAAAQRRTALVYHERFLWHDAGPAASVIPAGGMVEPGPHAESPERVRRINALIEVSGLGEQPSAAAAAAGDAGGARPVPHRRVYRARARLSDGPGGDAGEYAPVGPSSFEIASLAAGACLTAVDAVVGGDADNAYALVRPPGHHALADQGMGGCLFANTALAALHARAAHGLTRIAVVDWDAHHGNGTQEAFARRSGRPDRLPPSGRLLPARLGAGRRGRRGPRPRLERQRPAAARLGNRCVRGGVRARRPALRSRSSGPSSCSSPAASTRARGIPTRG